MSEEWNGIEYPCGCFAEAFEEELKTLGVKNKFYRITYLCGKHDPTVPKCPHCGEELEEKDLDNLGTAYDCESCGGEYNYEEVWG